MRRLKSFEHGTQFVELISEGNGSYTVNLYAENQAKEELNPAPSVSQSYISLDCAMDVYRQSCKYAEKRYTNNPVVVLEYYPVTGKGKAIHTISKRDGYMRTYKYSDNRVYKIHHITQNWRTRTFTNSIHIVKE